MINQEKNVHTEYCCRIHGCKYGDDHCPVEKGYQNSTHPCEFCEEWDMKYKTGKIWVSSDNHFFHSNIIRYCNRPFSNVNEMNDVMVENWNNLVSKDDTVLHLGDFAFRQSENVKTIRQRLNGNIHLLMGNHDNLNQVKYAGFASVRDGFWDYKFYDEETKQNKRVFLCHYPCLSWRSSAHMGGIVHLHGHIHTSPFNTYSHVGFHPGSYDVGVDNNNFKPILLQDAIAICEKQKTERFGKEGIKKGYYL